MKSLIDKLVCFAIVEVISAGPIGYGEGLDCDFNQLIEEVECNLAQGFNVSLS